MLCAAAESIPKLHLVADKDAGFFRGFEEGLAGDGWIAVPLQDRYACNARLPVSPPCAKGRCVTNMLAASTVLETVWNLPRFIVSNVLGLSQHLSAPHQSPANKKRPALGGAKSDQGQ